MKDEHSRLAMDAIAHAAAMAEEAWKVAAYERQRPSVLYRPTLSADGNKWCFLLGDDLQAGVAGFGDTPNEAAYAFDQAFWNEKTPDAMLAARTQED